MVRILQDDRSIWLGGNRPDQTLTHLAAMLRLGIISMPKFTDEAETIGGVCKKWNPRYPLVQNPTAFESSQYCDWAKHDIAPTYTYE